ncbi:MAG: class IV adenylate cyclase [Candidatus Nomurabacteria bacterium]|nr:class IV adenylate cyclase [Candidatus Nomurabacteria bacterium]
MNIEVEVKVKIDNFREIKKKVSTIGKLIKTIKQIDDYYIPCHRDFFAQKPHPTEWMRIKTNPDKTFFEYDRSMKRTEAGGQGYAEEYETEISNAGEFKKILEFLDFKKVITVEKQREYWMCGNMEIALDYIKGLGYFIEAEAKGNFKNTKEAKRTCIRLLEDLGIKDVENNQIKTGYPQLLMASWKKGK